MRWTTKARLQAFLGALPEPIGNPLYYALQTLNGSFREAKNRIYQDAALALAEKATACGVQIRGARAVEVGTGRRVTLPVCLWLMGAERIHTVDLHRYLNDHTLNLDLRALLRDEEFCGHPRVDPARVAALARLVEAGGTRDQLFALCGLHYLAPADATRLALPAASVDLHFSFTVFEHIPASILVPLLAEAARILRPDGIALHLIDHSDHFSHTDRSLSPIHFLQFDDAQWDRLAGNRYMFMNRLRADDYESLYARAGHDVIHHECHPDGQVRAALRAGNIRLAPRFADKPHDILAGMSSWIGSRKRRA
ncbi:methyltransferase domain-containing protein [Oleiharenicola sp. Vm1]|uniref:methyltransferase domain-containing protein n=1 Tax=Oleiharenicola sp. Vm1 TaxID=3398393 RepID=UPI0039F5411D